MGLIKKFQYKSKKKIIFLFLLIVISNFFVLRNVAVDKAFLTFQVNIMAEKADIFQVFLPMNDQWTEELSEKKDYTKFGETEKIKFNIPYHTDKIRLDLGSNIQKITIQEMQLISWFKKWDLMQEELGKIVETNQLEVNRNQKTILINSIGNDPYIVIDFYNKTLFSQIDSWNRTIEITLKFGICILIDILLVLLSLKSKSVLILMTELYNNRELIWKLSKNDFKTKYAGSYLGIIWAFINPIVTILIYWFVFSYGLKAGSPIEGVPFVLWFIAGLIPWFFFQEALLNATTCMIEYSYLVKKVVFKISILPIIKIVSALLIHVVFVVFLLVVSFIYNIKINIMVVQLLYYSMCTFILVLGISYATSAIILFFKDLMQIISIVLQLGMWMTPIMWSYTIIPEKYQWIAKLNPMFYIVEGYRDTLLRHVWFWERYFQTALFWVVALSFFGIGALIFKKLKPHFSDVL